MLSDAAPALIRDDLKEKDRARVQSLIKEIKKEARRKKRNVHHLADFWCLHRGTTAADTATLKVVSGYADEFGPEIVSQWVLAAIERLPKARPDEQIGRYISGIRRHELDKAKIGK